MKLKKYLILLLLGFCLVTPVSAAPPVREVRVAVAVTPDFKAIPNWKSEFERRLGYVSKVFESQFRVKFKMTAMADWNVPAEKANMPDLCEDLRSRFPLENLENVDVVIGLTRLAEIPPTLSMQDLHSIGLARPFSGYLVLRYPVNKLYKIQEETVLVHEMGHLFGAVHTLDRSSIMFPIVEKQIPNRFDGDNEQILQQTRDMDFRKGINVLQGPTLQIILNSYMKLIRTEQSADFYYALGIFYLQLGQTENTVRSWTQSLMVEDEPQVHYDLGILYYKLGKQDQAVKELSKAVAKFHYPSLKEKEFSALSILGKAYLAQNNLLAAWSSFKRALSIKPNDLDTQTQLAIVEVKRGNYQEGLQLLLRASHREPNNPTIQTAIGTAYFNMKKYQEAIGYFSTALSQLGNKPTNQTLELYSYLGNCYMKMGKPDQALSFLVEACKADPSVECHKKLGIISFQMGLWDNCIGELAPVVERDKTDPDAFGALGVCLHQKKDISNAIGVFREGIESSKDNKIQARFYNNIGQILLGERAYGPAQTEFQASLSKDWSNPEAHLGLATAYRGSGQLSNAKDTLQNALRIDSKNAQARMMLTAVENEMSRAKKS